MSQGIELVSLLGDWWVGQLGVELEGQLDKG